MMRMGIAAVLMLMAGAMVVSGFTADGSTLTEEEAYGQRWTREELEETLALSREWLDSDIGRGEYAPPPWTPMEVDGQDVKCWGRTYRYEDSILPVQIISAGRELLGDRPRFIMLAGGVEYEFSDAAVSAEKKHDGLVEVRTVSASGPYTLTLKAGYEFDGMGRVELRLDGRRGAPDVERFHLEIPLEAGNSTLYHFNRSRIPVTISPRPRRIDNHQGFVDDEYGDVFNTFREIIWLGGTEAGLTWFADSMKGWEIKDETRVQMIMPVEDGLRNFRVKFADRNFSASENPLELVFGIQATPMKPRRADFRSLPKRAALWGDDRTFHYQFRGWNDGHYYLAHNTYPDEAREFVLDKRERGIEVLPISSLEYFGTLHAYSNTFGVLDRPGMKVREMMFWGDLWGREWRSPRHVDYETAEAVKMKKEVDARRERGGIEGGYTLEEVMEMKHVGEGDWFSRKGIFPSYLYECCPATTFQDYYLWTLKKFIEDTQIKALYLDQPLWACMRAEHGCGYVDYKGEWAPEAPVFAAREMLKRIYFLFYELNGEPPLIYWHRSRVPMNPAMSFIDVHACGEGYRSHIRFDRSLIGRHFHSEFMDEGFMQVGHMGRQFGYSSDFLPQIRSRPFRERSARVGLELNRTPATERDLAGLLMVHDAFLRYNFLNFPEEAHRLQKAKFAYPLEEMDVSYYWEDGGGVEVSPGRVKHILHYDGEKALLILFNWSDELAFADVKLDPAVLGVSGGNMLVTDVLTGLQLSRREAEFTIDVAPRDLKMLDVRW